MRLLKILRLLIHLFLGVFLTLLLAGVLRQSSRDAYFSKIKRWWLQRVSHLLAIEFTVFGKPADTTVLYAANHISWIDIPLLAGQVNPIFLSKAEIRAWPVIGWMAHKAGTLFIHRGNHSSAKSITQAMTQTLVMGKQNEEAGSRYSILFFPEGTTSDGTDLLRLRPRLFVAAINAQVAIQPILIHYPDPHQFTNPVVPFTGQQTLLKNLWQILGQRRIKAEVHFLDTLSSQGKSSKKLAQTCETLLRQKLEQLPGNNKRLGSALRQ